MDPIDSDCNSKHFHKILLIFVDEPFHSYSDDMCCLLPFHSLVIEAAPRFQQKNIRMKVSEFLLHQTGKFLSYLNNLNFIAGRFD